MYKGYATEPQDGAPPVLMLTDEQEAAVQECAWQREEVLGSGLINEAHPVPVADTAIYEVKGLIEGPNSRDYHLIPEPEAGQHSRLVPAILDASFEVLFTDTKVAARIAQGYYVQLANIDYIDRWLTQQGLIAGVLGVSQTTPTYLQGGTQYERQVLGLLRLYQRIV